MNEHLEITVTRFDGRYVVRASEPMPVRKHITGEFVPTDLDLGRRSEHTHCRAFITEEKAQRLVDRVREALRDGRDLNLEHWTYTGI